MFNWLFARRHDSRVILRFDDTDRLRSRPEYEAAIERALACLGLDRDHRERQSERLVASLDPLVATVDFARVGRASARFSEEELAHLTARTLHLLRDDVVRDRLPAVVDEALWLAIRGNLETLADAAGWAEIVRGAPTPALEDPGFLAEAATRLPPEPWTVATWKDWCRPSGWRPDARAGRSFIRCGWR